MLCVDVWGSDGILLVLGDTGDVEYPLYRQASDTDTGYTLATVLFSVQFGEEGDAASLPHAASSVTLYMSNPKTNKSIRITKPLVVE